MCPSHNPNSVSCDGGVVWNKNHVQRAYSLVLSLTCVYAGTYMRIGRDLQRFQHSIGHISIQLKICNGVIGVLAVCGGSPRHFACIMTTDEGGQSGGGEEGNLLGTANAQTENSGFVGYPRYSDFSDVQPATEDRASTGSDSTHAEQSLLKGNDDVSKYG